MTDDLGVRRLLEDASAELDSAPDVQRLWETGTRRRRHRQVLAVGAVAASVVLTVAIALGLTGQDTRPHTVGVPTPEPTRVLDPLDNRDFVSPITDNQVRPVFDPTDLTSVPWRDTVGPRSWDPVDAVPLAEDPVDRAVLAHQSSGEEPHAISILGDDGRWRSVDVSDIEFSDSAEFEIGVSRSSLSSDGTLLAIGQRDGVVVVDLTTGERTTYDVAGLGPVWQGRFPTWGADGRTVYLGFGFYRKGSDLAIDLDTGEVTSVPFSVADSVFLRDGTVLEDHFQKLTGSDLRSYDADGQVLRATTSTSGQLGVLDFLVTDGELVAARSEQTYYTDADGEGPLRSGVLVMDPDGRARALLPVEGYQNHGGGGTVLGWADPETVLFGVYRGEGPGGMSVLAWQIESGEITRVADYTFTRGLAVAAALL